MLIEPVPPKPDHSFLRRIIEIDTTTTSSSLIFNGWDWAGRRMRQVYPRACGETQEQVEGSQSVLGLSPRMRGNQFLDDVLDRGFGSIPAHAGKPVLTLDVMGQARVYPRACGETKSTSGLILIARGLSPRMRGNRPGARRSQGRPGSIPAHAGKPWHGPDLHEKKRVYPRACGETRI